MLSIDVLPAGDAKGDTIWIPLEEASEGLGEFGSLFGTPGFALQGPHRRFQ